MRLDDFFIDEPSSAPNAPTVKSEANPSAAQTSSSSLSPADKMRLCIELLSDISSWTANAARKPIEDTIAQLTVMLTSVGGN